MNLGRLATWMIGGGLAAYLGGHWLRDQLDRKIEKQQSAAAAAGALDATTGSEDRPVATEAPSAPAAEPAEQVIDESSTQVESAEQ